MTTKPHIATLVSAAALVTATALASSGNPKPAAGAGAETASAANSGAASADRSRAAFTRFASLEGRWRGKSTKGWTEEATFQNVAGGSAILETTVQDKSENPMATVFHVDGDRFLLTHYCMAKNHPRLVASAIEEDGKAITFTFLDGTNLPSRDKGHMDKAVYRFEDADHYTTRWTWYQDGKERWMEEIRMERVK